jgi:hypothetical protein
MKKIPTLFKRDWNSKTRHVINEVNEGCEWVLAGEGVATRKYDGNSCLIRNGKFYKRREVKAGKPVPADFEQVHFDPMTHKTIGWVPVNFDAPEDKYFIQAFENSNGNDLPDGTYEAVGARIQGGNEGESYRLISHDRAEVLEDVPRDYEGLVEYLRGISFEGVVFHRNPDSATGDMVKIKKRDLPPL